MITEKSPDERQTPTVEETIQNRKSGIAFDPDRPVEQQLLLSMIESARWTPSCYNEQPWRFIVCRKDGEPDAWQAVFDALIDKNQRWSRFASVFLVVCANTLFSHNDIDNPWCLYDTGAAAISAVLQATQDGLMAHQMAGFNADLLRDSFQVPDQYKLAAVMAVGYALPAERIPEEFRHRESLPRGRKTVQEIATFGSWGELS